MKLMVVGHATHGKDTVCGILKEEYGLTFVSSSYFAMEKVVVPYLAARGIVYPSLDACYADRVNHREKWHKAIAEYNEHDPAKLGRELYAQSDIYCGLRSAREFYALSKEKAFNVSFWVDRIQHIGPEPTTSNKITSVMADYIIDNNGTLDELRANVIEAYRKAFAGCHLQEQE